MMNKHIFLLFMWMTLSSASASAHCHWAIISLRMVQNIPEN